LQRGRRRDPKDLVALIYFESYIPEDCMKLPRKLPKRLFKDSEVISPYKNGRSRQSRRSYMTREHQDVLQNIEAALVGTARRTRAIDDRMIDQALRICIEAIDLPEDCDARVSALCSNLESVRSLRTDISNDTWICGLRTVHDSVKVHSTRMPGDTGYLDFVSQFV
jgi:hypothetical protein